MGSDDKRWWDIISVGCPCEVAPDDWNRTSRNVRLLVMIEQEQVRRGDRKSVV